LMMSEFQQKYYKTDEPTLCFNPPASLSIEKLTVQNDIDPPMDIDENYCVHDVTREGPFNIDLVVKNENENKPLTLETTLVKGGQRKLANTENNPNAPCPTKRPTDYIDLSKEKSSSLPCNATGNFIWNGKSSCEKPPKVNGNLYITGEFDKENYNLHVTGTVTFKNEVDLDKHSVLTVGGNACFNDETDVDDSTIRIAGSSVFSDEFDMEDSTMNIDGNTQFYREFDVDDSEVGFGGRTEFFDEFDVEDSNIRIGGPAIFHKEFDYEGEDLDGVNDQSKYFVQINGEALFKNEVDFDDGTLNITGPAEFIGETQFEDSHVTLDSVIFNKKVEIKDTIMNVTKDLTSNSSEFRLKDKSSLNVSGTSKFSMKPEVSDKSTICLKSDSALSSRSCPK